MEDKPSILIVDDNISQCKTMSFVLQHKGYAVACACNGPEAIEEVRKRPFDIIFMDIKMPLMNGVETYRRIKKTRHGSVVIMMTAYAGDTLVEEALQQGARGVMYKPLDMEGVLKSVDDIFVSKASVPRTVEDSLSTQVRRRQTGIFK